METENNINNSDSRLSINASSSLIDSRFTPHDSRLQDDEIDLIEYIKIIWKYKWFVILVTIFAVVGTYFYTKSLPKIYSSTVSVIIPQEEGAGSSLSAVLGGMGFGDLVGGNSNADLVVEVLKSRRLSERVSSHFNLPSYYDGTITLRKIEKIVKVNNILAQGILLELQKKGYIDYKGKPLRFYDPSDVRYKLDVDPIYLKYQDNLTKLYKSEHKILKDFIAVKKLMSNMKIETVKGGLIKVKVEDTNPIMATNIANYYISEMDRMNEDLQITTKKPMLKVLDPAIIPLEKLRPIMTSNLAIALLVSLFISVLITFFIEYLLLAIKENR